MLDNLAGRLKWEQTGAGIRFDIPARRGVMAIFYGPLIGVCLAIASLHYWVLMNAIVSDDARSALLRFGVDCFAVGVCVLACWLLWTLTATTILTIDPSQLRIQRRVIGVEWDTRTFATRDVRNLQYVPPTYIWALWTDTNPNTSKIHFKVKNKTCCIASGITEREACALIDRMMEVYKFPKDNESDYKAVAR